MQGIRITIVDLRKVMAIVKISGKTFNTVINCNLFSDTSSNFVIDEQEIFDNNLIASKLNEYF